jgi:hypothetical protein
MVARQAVLEQLCRVMRAVVVVARLLPVRVVVALAQRARLQVAALGTFTGVSLMQRAVAVVVTVPEHWLRLAGLSQRATVPTRARLAAQRQIAALVVVVAREVVLVAQAEAAMSVSFGKPQTYACFGV